MLLDILKLATNYTQMLEQCSWTKVQHGSFSLETGVISQLSACAASLSGTECWQQQKGKVETTSNPSKSFNSMECIMIIKDNLDGHRTQLSMQCGL